MKPSNSFIDEIRSVILKLEIFQIKESVSPTSRNLKIILLAQGTYNKNYLVKFQNTSFVFRVNIEQQSGDAQQIRKEYNILRFLDNKVNVPRPIYISFDNNFFNNGFMILEYLPGYPSKPGLDTAKIIGLELAKLHKVKIPDIIKMDNRIDTYSVENVLLLCARLYDSVKIRLPHKKSLLENYERLIDKASVTAAILGPGLFTNRCIVHGDLVPNNLIFHNEKISIIDWETFSYCHWIYDLWAILAPAYNKWYWKRAFTANEKYHLLERYCQEMDLKIEDAVHLLNILTPLYNLRYSLWCLKKYLDYVDNKIPSSLMENGGEKNFIRLKYVSKIALEAGLQVVKQEFTSQ